MTETSMPTAWLIFHLSVLASISNTAPASDLVINLPGLNFTPKFASYSGYLKASKKDMFHYWFTESQQNPSTDPLILWLNGGPGCSSLGGLMEELGPFKLKDYGTVVYSNECSWNLFANVLFLESPSGVGYSFNTDANFTTNDDDVAKHNYYALVDFLGKFPEYRGRDTYIMGESYAGVYLPTLGVKIISDPFNFPNFKGVAMGNGALNVAGNYDTIVPVYYYHGLIRDELYFNFSSTCCGSNIERCNIVAALSDPTCSTLLSEIFQATNDLDPYNIYSTCYSTSFVGKKAQIERFLRKAANLPTRNIRKTPFGIPLYDQIGNTEDYLNRADVRKALHIPVFLLKWSDCSTAVEGSYVTTHYDMLPEIEEINAAGVKERR